MKKSAHPLPPGPPVWLHRIATAVPPTALSQTAILEFMRRELADTPAKTAFLERVYQGSAIETRHSVLPDYGRSPADFEFLSPDPAQKAVPGTAARNALFDQESKHLAIKASRDLLAALPWLDPQSITHLVSLSCTGFAAPGFDLAVQTELALAPSLKRQHLGFMGCFAAFPALRLAADICRSDPRAKVLIVDVELCTLHFQTGWDPEQVVANALFADGAAAALVSADPNDSGSPWFSLQGFSTKLLPQSADRMAWTIGDTGFLMQLSSYVPKLIEANLAGILDALLSQNGLDRQAIGHWAIHPGGRAILDRLVESLQLPENALASSYRILRDFGNMSSATLFFVLADLAAQDPGPGPKTVFAAAFGPGLTVESGLLERLPARTGATRPRHEPLFLPRLNQRLHREELMDRADISLERLKRTIAQFRLLNRLFSAYRRILKRELFGRLPANSEPAEITVLDLGCGGGDIAIWLARTARKRGQKLRITGIDPDGRIIPWAKAAVAAYPEIQIIQASSDDLASLGSFDFIVSNHVLHHLPNQGIVELLARAAPLARRALILNDLRRSTWAYIGYSIFTTLFIHRSLARYDGRLSIRRGFTKPELESMIRLAGLEQRLMVKTASPARLIICPKDDYRGKSTTQIKS